MSQSSSRYWSDLGGHCVKGDAACVCGGDTAAVRNACANWRNSKALPFNTYDSETLPLSTRKLPADKVAAIIQAAWDKHAPDVMCFGLAVAHEVQEALNKGGFEPVDPALEKEALAQMRHLVNEIVVAYKDEYGLTRYIVKDGNGLMFSNMAAACKRMLKKDS